MISRLGETVCLLLLLLVAATPSESIKVEFVSAAAAAAAATSIAAAAAAAATSIAAAAAARDEEPPRLYDTPPVPLPVHTRAGQRQLKLLRGQTTQVQPLEPQRQHRRRLGRDKETEVPLDDVATATKAPATQVPDSLVPAPSSQSSAAPVDVVPSTRTPAAPPTATTTSQPVNVTTTPAPITQRPTNETAIAAPTQAPAMTQPQPPTPPPTFNNNVNVTTVVLSPFTVQVQADAPEQDPTAVYAIFRREIRKTLQKYLASALDYENLVFVQLTVSEDNNGRRRRRRRVLQEQQQQQLVDLDFRYTGHVVFRSVAPDRTDVLFRQREALMDDSTNNARQTAVQNNDILKAGNVKILAVQVDTNNNNNNEDKSVSDDNDDDSNQVALIGGIVAAVVVVLCAVAILVWYRPRNPSRRSTTSSRSRRRRRPPTVVRTGNNQNDKPKSNNNDKATFSPYGKENDDQDDSDDEGRIIPKINSQATTADVSSPKSYLQLSPSGSLAKQEGLSSADDDNEDDDHGNAAVAIVVPDSPDDEKDDDDNPRAAVATTTTTPGPHPRRNLETTSLLGTGARLMGASGKAPLHHPMDEDIMMIQGAAALHSISNDDSEKIVKQNSADQLYSVPILQVARSEDSSVDGYSMDSGYYKRTSANKNAPAATITLIPSLSSPPPPPPPPPARPSWLQQPGMASTPHQQQQRQQQQHHHDSDGDDGSEYTSDSESQFTREKSMSNNKTALSMTPTLLPRALSVDSGEDDDSVLLSLRDRLPSHSTKGNGGGGGAATHVYDYSAPPVRSVYSADLDVSSSLDKPNDTTITDEDLLRQSVFSPRLVGVKDDALGFKLMDTPATALPTPSPNVSRITRGYENPSDADDSDDIFSDAGPWDESKDKLDVSGGSDLAAQLDSLKRQADEMLAAPVAGLPRDGDELVVPPPPLRTTTPQTAAGAHRTPGSVRRRGKPQA